MTAEASTTTPTADADSTDFVRLHISPLDSELVKIVLPAAVQSVARNVSFHTIDTFPERRYGFVEVPRMEADKIKRKLHGATLKGSKMRIEKARPEQRLEVDGEEERVETKQERKERKKRERKRAKEDETGSKKRKREIEVVEGAALTDRKVKRGWTDPLETKRKRSKKDKDGKRDKEKAKDQDHDRDDTEPEEKPKQKEQEKKKRPKSKYTDQEECLLKTKVPPNAVGNLSEDTFRKKKKNKTKSREVTVHEFEKTTKFPGFLKSAVDEAGGRLAAEFVEGKGWVDGEGGLVEAVKPGREVVERKKKVSKVKPEVVQEEDDSTSSSGTSSEGSDSDSDSDSDSSPDPPGAQQSRHATPPSAIKGDTSRPMSSTSSNSLTIKIPPPTTPSAPKVHPLEALYKRAKPDTTVTETPVQQAAQPFSFFDQGDDDEEDSDNREKSGSQPSLTVPMTPFTRQDFEWRNIRSAAPTPDTAHPSRMQNFWPSQDEGDQDAMDEDGPPEMGDEEGVDADAAPAQSSSDFQTWFWANRSQLNRSWMQRRKTVSKEKRHRENKARASKAV